MSALWESPFFGVTLTILAYWAGCRIQKRTGLVICNGLVLAVGMIVAVLVIFDIPYEAYNAGGSLINLFLGPATVCLAVTIYAQIDQLKKNLLPILAGCAAGALTSVLSIWGLCRLFGLDRELKDTTRLIVAQRIGTIRNADKIIVLDEGKMVGMGTHRELMQTCPVYQEIAWSQLSREELGA